MPSYDPSLDDEAFLDLLLDRALAERSSGRTVDLDAALAGREHLRERADEILALAADLAPKLELRPMQEIVRRIADYTVLGEAGRGGMGIVYRARQERLGRIVALKVLAPALTVSSRARARFDVEARALGRVRHPNVVAVYDVVATEEVCAYAMEWIDGQSLSSTLAQGGPAIDVRAVLELGITLAAALVCVHGQGLVHRDIKPSNVLRRADGTPVLSDFGLVRDAEHSMHTATGEFLGTMAYAAPEQLRGRHDEVGPWTDVYALAATLHSALTGAPPFAAGSTAGMLRSVETGARTPLRRINGNVPRELETVLAKAMEPAAARRYATAAAFAEDLRRVRDREPIAARPAGAVVRTRLWIKRNPVVATAAGALLLTSALTSWQMFEAMSARANSERNLGRAQRAIARLVTVARDELRDAVGMTPQREAMLRSALHFYEELASDHPGDARTSREWAIARVQAGALRKELGELEGAAAELDAALALLEPAAAAPDAELPLLEATAVGLRELAGVEFERERLGSARAVAGRCVVLYQRLLQRLPEHWQRACDLFLFQATLAFHAEQWDQFEHWAAAAMNLLPATANGEELPVEALQLRARVHYHRSAAHCRRANVVDGRACLELAVADLRLVAAALPNSRSARGRLAEALLKHAELVLGSGDAMSAATSVRDAEARYASLARDFPEVADYRDALDAARTLATRIDAAHAERARQQQGRKPEPEPRPVPTSLREQAKLLREEARAARASGDATAEVTALAQLFAIFDPSQVRSWRDVEAVLRELPFALRGNEDRQALLERVTGWHAGLHHLGAAPPAVSALFGEAWLLRAVMALGRGDGPDAEAAALAALPLVPREMAPEAEIVHAEAVISRDPARGLQIAEELAARADAATSTAAERAWRTGSCRRVVGMAQLALQRHAPAMQAWCEALPLLEQARAERKDDVGLRAEWVRLVLATHGLQSRGQPATVPLPDLNETLRDLQGLRPGPRGPAARHLTQALVELASLPESLFDAEGRSLRDSLRTGR